jgi:hypothetical protein
MVIAPSATHLFEEPRALEKVGVDERRLDESLYRRFSKTPEAES